MYNMVSSVKRLCLFVLCFLSSYTYAQVAASVNGTVSPLATGVIAGSQINLLPSISSNVQLKFTVLGTPASFSIQIESSTNNGSTYSLCGTANTSTSGTIVINCNGNFDHAQVDITTATGGSSPSVVWSLVANVSPPLTFTNTLGFSIAFNTYMVPLTNAATTLTTVTGAYRFYCNNITAGAITITITDNQGSPISFVTAFSLAANSNVRFPPGEGLIKMQGIKWNASANASINCTVDGFQ